MLAEAHRFEHEDDGQFEELIPTGLPKQQPADEDGGDGSG
jgi:hypothetical protein